ncbi:Synaptic vesicle transporter SVOP and related transporters (major facilitator superfamily) [Phaffia rhodozyma]|uniref:Synaptic vesicle transporter SVOP and related transporters (Major facilitator superfamily) n=1 Tax=Phaffia rhodozyma TaxID=264483 RepID=A0A0F7SVD2_PHARH|nr:Synaptic vesicle transporter SVOP and related transporters (major facilitator superfamily) [Phaffia rhodozyma]
MIDHTTADGSISPSAPGSPRSPASIAALPSSSSIHRSHPHPLHHYHHHRHESSEDVSCANTLYDYEISSTGPQTAVNTPSAEDKLFHLAPSWEKSHDLGSLPEGKVGEETQESELRPKETQPGIISGEPLHKVGSVLMDGQLYPTRSGRGERFEEPLTDVRTHEEIIYIDFPIGDPEDPLNWLNLRKWIITLCCVSITSLTAFNATAYSLAFSDAQTKLGVSKVTWTIGNTLFLVGISFTPLFLAPYSELIGRNKIYLVTSFLNTILCLPQALCGPTGIFVSRFFQGMCSSVGNSMVGGSIADMFPAESRGQAMSVYSLFVFWGQALGPAMMGWVSIRLGYQWTFWLELIMFGGLFVVLIFALKETRGSILLSRRAVKLTKQTGKPHAAPGDAERKDIKTLVKISISRPLIFLFTEPIVSAISLWVGFVWGCLFLFINSVAMVFGQYGFNSGESGLVLLTLGIAATIGVLIEFHQNVLYQKATARAGGRAEPEARLYWTLIGAFIFPAGIFWYAWTGRPGISWVSPAAALLFANIGIYLCYTGVFNYLSDCYEQYSSSAQAAQSLLRNLFAAVFPLFAPSLYENLGYPYASTLLGCIAFVGGFCPLLIFLYGKKLRARSKIACALLS